MKMTIEKFFRTLLAAAFAVGLAREAFAASPGELHYQGKVTSSAGVPLPDGTVNLVFSLWDSANGGAKFVGSDVIVNNVPIANGVFGANFTPPLATIQGNPTVYLQVQVNGKVFDTPRQKLVAAPFALSIAGDSVRTAEIQDGEVALADMNTTDVDGRYATLGTAQTMTGVKTINANWVNTANPWADNEVSDTLTVGAAGSVSATAVQPGSLGASVIASSIAVNAVTNPSIVSMAASKLTGALPALDGSALTGVTASNVAASDVLAGSLGGSVIASSIAVNAVTNPSIVSLDASKLTGALPAISGASLTNLTAANISAGSLGGSVIASSIAVNAVSNPSIVSLAASKLTGALPAISGASLTNLTAANISAGSLGGSVIASSIAVNAVTNPSIVSLDASKLTGLLPAIDGSALTGVTANNVAAANVQAGSLGASVIASSIAVNAVQNPSIVSLDASKLTGALPAISGASLTNLTAANISAGSLGGSVIASSIAVNAVSNPSIVSLAASKLTGALPAISGASLTNLTAANISAGSLGGSVIASSIAVNAVTNPSIVSLAASKLTGALPAISGASLTNLTAANISAGSLGGSVIASSVAINSINNAQVAPGAAIVASKIVGGTFDSGTDFQIAAGDSLGIGVAPSNPLQVNGPIATKIRSVASNTTLDASDSIVIVDTGGGNRTITLPVMNAATAGRELKIFNIGTNNLTIQRQGGSEKINNVNSLTSTTRYEAFVVVGDGSDWWASKLTP